MSTAERSTLEARVAWSRLVEPGDAVAGALIDVLGPVDALAWVRQQAVDRAPHAQTPARSEVLRALGPEASARVGRAVQRWAPRLATLDPESDLRHIAALGGTVVVPEDDTWPARLDELGAARPACLWVRGESDLRALLDVSVALIGSRACTGYGEHVTSDLAAGVVDRGWTVVSGGAYGIDAVAHRSAVAVGGRTVAFLAGGADRLYPAGNAHLLRAVIERGGAVVAEVPPGGVPSRTRFLQRNRLIAAAAAGTVVVEAAWRSGALNTAGHAAALMRPVGAVPGPVTSAASAGCHRLLRDGGAVCVTDADEVVELVGPAGTVPPVRSVVRGALDGLGEEARRAADALPRVRPVSLEAVMLAAGLTVHETRAALGVLEMAGVARQQAGGWCLAPAMRGAAGESGQVGHPGPG